MLVTDRVILRLPQPADAPEIVDYFERNREHLDPMDPTRPDGFHTVQFWQQRVAIYLDEFARDQSARMIVLPADQPQRVIGTVSLSAVQRGPLQAANLGYGIDRALQGRGLMHEALRATIGYAFGPLNLHRLFAGYIPTNDRSARVVRRLGFEVMGYCRDYLLINGKWQDHVLTTLVNPRWQAT